LKGEGKFFTVAEGNVWSREKGKGFFSLQGGKSFFGDKKFGKFLSGGKAMRISEKAHFFCKPYPGWGSA